MVVETNWGGTFNFKILRRVKIEHINYWKKLLYAASFKKL